VSVQEENRRAAAVKKFTPSHARCHNFGVDSATVSEVGENPPAGAEAAASKAAESEHLSGGALLSAISTRIVGVLREHYGRGPMKAKTYVLDDLIICVLRNGFTKLEQTMVDSGEAERVVEMRHDFQRMMGVRYRELIEELTGRKVVAFLSQSHVDPDITLEVFFIDRPLDGFGAAELIELPRIDAG
jgi:uncharacterized protein YbcI